jgi:hypothetical protein
MPHFSKTQTHTFRQYFKTAAKVLPFSPEEQAKEFYIQNIPFIVVDLSLVSRSSRNVPGFALASEAGIIIQSQTSRERVLCLSFTKDKM